MGFLSLFGFNKPRDAPELPDIQDNVRDSRNLFVFGMTHSGERVDERTAMQIVTVYACVRLLSNTIAGLPLHLYRYTGNGEDKEMAFDHPLYKILYRQPNPEMSSFSFWEAMMCHLLLWGNAYAQIVRDGKNGILGLYPLLPENVEIDRDPKSGDLFYTYHAYTDERPGENNKDIIFQRDEILHIPGLGFNGLVGFSPIAMMKNALGAVMAVERYGSAFFKNGAQPAGVLEHPGIRRRSGTTGQGHTAALETLIAVLEEGMSYKPISLPPEDSQFLSTREFDVEEICRMFQVPPHLVQDLKRSTFNNIEHQGIAFVQYSLMPWIIRIEKGIIKDLLLEEEKDTYFPKFNVDGLMRGDYQSRMNAYAIGVGNGFMSLNDVRRLENMDLIPDDQGGNDYYLNGSYNKLQDAGASYGLAQSQQDNQPDTEKDNEPNDNPEEETDDRFLRKKRRKKYRNGVM